MRGSPCSPPSLCGNFILPQISRRPSVKAPDKWEDLISVLHPQKSSQHGVPGDQIVRPDPIDGHNGRIVVQICEGLQNVCDALTSAFVDRAYWKGAVARSTCFKTCLATVLATNRRIMSPTTIPLTPPSGFCKAVIRPNRMPSMISDGTFLVARLDHLHQQH